MSIFATLASALGIGKQIKDLLDSLQLSPEEKARLEAELMKIVLQSQTKIITSEASSESWLTRSWRPITMLTFLAILVADAFGWTSGVDKELRMKLLDIIHFGLGGYVIGRSFEKTLPKLAEFLGGLKK